MDLQDINSNMRCCGRNSSLKRCGIKKEIPWFYPFCKHHRLQPIVFVTITFVGIFANWSALYVTIFPDQSNEKQTLLLEQKLEAVELAVESLSEEGFQNKLKSETGFSVEELRVAIPKLREIANSDYEKGNVEFLEGNYENALQFYTDAIVLNPSFKLAFNKRGSCYGRIEKLEEATEDLKKAISIDSNYHSAWYNLGLSYAKLKKYDLAIDCYKKVMEIDSNYLSSYINIASVLTKSKKYDEAISNLKTAIRIQPDYANSYNNLGFVFEKQSKYGQAIEYYNKAIKKDPDYYSPYTNKIFVYGLQGKNDKVIEVCNTLITRGMTRWDSYSNRAYAYYLKKDYTNAISDYNKAIKLKEKNPKLHYYKAKSLIELDSFPQAISCFNSIINIDPNYKDVDSLFKVISKEIN